MTELTPVPQLPTEVSAAETAYKASLCDVESADDLMQAIAAGNDPTSRLHFNHQPGVLEKLYDRYDLVAGEAGAFNAKIRPVAEAVVGAPKRLTLSAVAFDRCVERLEDAQAQQEAFLPEKAASVIEFARQIENSLDYTQLAASAFASLDESSDHGGLLALSSLHEVSRLILLREHIEDTDEYTYSDLLHVEAALLSYTNEWRQKGLFLDDTTSDTSAPEADSLKVSVAALRQQIEEADELYTTYKHPTRDFELRKAIILGTIDQVSEDAVVPDTISAIFGNKFLHYNAELDSAISQWLADDVDKLIDANLELREDSAAHTKRVAEACDIDALEAVEAIEVSISNDLAVEYSADDLRNFLHMAIPPIALQAIESFEFRPLTNEEDATDNGMGINRFNRNTGKYSVVVSSDMINRMREELSEVLDRGEVEQGMDIKGAKLLLLRVVAHEAAHTLHHVLPVATLRMWEQMRRTEQVFVSGYVEECHNKEEPNTIREDFAETMQLYIVNPHLLTQLSPARYSAMQQIFSEFMPSSIVSPTRSSQ